MPRNDRLSPIAHGIFRLLDSSRVSRPSRNNRPWQPHQSSLSPNPSARGTDQRPASALAQLTGNEISGRKTWMPGIEGFKAPSNFAIWVCCPPARGDFVTWYDEELAISHTTWAMILSTWAELTPDSQFRGEIRVATDVKRCG